MKMSLAWIKDYLDTSATDEDIIHQLSMLGLVVDAVEDPREALKDFKIVHVTSAEKHPDADRLNVCQVDTGEGMIQVVCGGINARTNIKAVLAPVGSTIPANGMVMKNAKVRGVESAGMLCALDELSLGENDPKGGIIELPSDAAVGEVYADYLGLGDKILDIDITPNRGDCLSAYGLARDLSAAGMGTLKTLQVPSVSESEKNPINVSIDTKDCAYFAGRVIKGVTNKPSPDWLQKKLKSVGINPKSALVDITNYLSYAVGRPMHVFDLSTLKDEVIVRKAKAGEEMVALNEETYTLDPSMTVIADSIDAHSIAGIMGGLDSSSTMETTDVFVESALFDAKNIALTGRELNILSDSRARFERGVDPAMVLPALDIATDFILNHCGGQACEKVEAGACPENRPQITLDPARVEKLTALNVDHNKIVEILQGLGFEIDIKTWTVTVPSWRNDVRLEADLIEEIARIYGYDHIPTLSLPMVKTEHAQSPAHDWHVRRTLASRGLNETMTWSFIKTDLAKTFGGGSDDLRVVNPISSDLTDMRPSLLPNLIEAAQRNHDRGQASVSLFEVGKQFTDTTDKGETLVAAGVRSGAATDKHWDQKQRSFDVFDVKKDALAAIEACGMKTDNLQVITPGPDYFHPGRSGYLGLGFKNKIAAFGEVHPSILQQLDIESKVSGFEVFMDKVPAPKSKKKPALKLSPYQPVERDFAFIVGKDVPANDVLQAAKKAENLITSVCLFDVYEGKGIPDDKKSIGFSVRIEPTEGTLNEDQLTHISDRIIKNVEKNTGGQLRS